MRNATYFQGLGGRRLVLGNPMRNRAVQTKIISECKMTPRAPGHDDKPAVRSDLDLNAVSGAILLHRIDECSLAVNHGSLVRWRTRRVQLATSAHLWASKLRLRAANDADVSRRSATGMVRKSGGQLPGNAGRLCFILS